MLLVEYLINSGSVFKEREMYHKDLQCINLQISYKEIQSARTYGLHDYLCSIASQKSK